MLDNERAVIGDNKPPAFDPEKHDELSEKVKGFLEATQKWLDIEKITTEEQAGFLSDQIDGLRGLYKNTDEQRKEQKKPHDEAGQAVQDAYNPILQKLKLAADKLKDKLGAYTIEKQKAEQEAQRIREAEAKRQEEEAVAKLAEAQESGDISAQVDAEAAAKKAEETAKEAAKPAKAQVKSASGAGRTKSLRSTKEVEVTNARLVFQHYQEHPEIIAVLTKLATAEVRAAGFDHEATPIPGVKVTVTQKLA